MTTIPFVNAADFGARPDTGEDCTEAVRQAIAYCRINGIGKLVFDKGRYDFKHPAFLEQYDLVMNQGVDMDLGKSVERKVIAFTLEEMIDFEWDGGFSRFVFHGLAQPFACERCANLRLHSFTIDWEQPLCSQGVVRAADDRHAEIELLGDHAVSGAVPVAALLDYVPVSDYPLIGKIDSFSQVNRTEQPAPDRLTLHYDKPQRLQPGMHLVMRHILNYRMGILLYECSNVKVADVTLHYTPGMGIIGHRSEQLEFVRLTVKPGAGRVLSTNTDATHFISCKRHISFNDCYFEGMGDDAVNVHGFYFRMKRRIDDYTVEAYIDIAPQSEKPEFPDAGDRVEWVRFDTLAPYADNEIDCADVGADAVLRLKFKRPLPESFMESDLLSNATRAASLSVANCTVRNNRARAILVQTRNAEIVNCTFDHCTGTALHLNCSIHWYESMAVSGVSIRNNTFIGCGFGSGTIGGASAMTVGTECAKSEAGVHRGIRFTDNVVEGRHGIGLRIDNAEDVLIERNRINACFPFAFVNDSRQVRIQSNQYDDDFPQILVGRGSDENAVILGDACCRIETM